MRVKRISLFTIIFVFLGISIFAFYEYYLTDDYRLFQKTSDEYEKSESLINEKKYDKALENLDELEAKYKDNKYLGLIQYTKGKAFYYKGDYNQALEYFGYADFFMKNNQNDNKIHNQEKLEHNLLVYQAISLSKLEEYKLSNSVFSKFIDENLEEYSDIQQELIKYQYSYNKVKLSDYDDVEKLLNYVIQNSSDTKLISDSFDLLTDYYKSLDDNDELEKHYKYAFNKTKNLKFLASLIELDISSGKSEIALSLIEDNKELLSENDPYTVNIIAFKGVIEYNQEDFNESFLTLNKAEQLLSIYEDKEDYHYINETIQVYKLYVHYKLEEYDSASNIIEELLTSDNTSEEVKSIAKEYQSNIEKLTNLPY